LEKEKQNLKCDLWLNNYCEQFVDLVTRNFGRKSQPDTQTVTVDMVVIPHVRVSQKNLNE
jgi:hypothetical protein